MRRDTAANQRRNDPGDDHPRLRRSNFALCVEVDLDSRVGDLRVGNTRATRLIELDILPAPDGSGFRSPYPSPVPRSWPYRSVNEAHGMAEAP